MEKADMKVVRFMANDVIATSAKIVTFKISGLGDRNYTTFGFTSSDNLYNYKSAVSLNNSKDSILSAQFNNGIDESKTLSDIIYHQYYAEGTGDNSQDRHYNSYNGTYLYDSLSEIYKKQTQ